MLRLQEQGRLLLRRRLIGPVPAQDVAGATSRARLAGSEDVEQRDRAHTNTTTAETSRYTIKR
jgi:hypothetical protein